MAVQWQLADCSDQLAGKDVYMHALPGVGGSAIGPASWNPAVKSTSPDKAIR